MHVLHVLVYKNKQKRILNIFQSVSSDISDICLGFSWHSPARLVGRRDKGSFVCWHYSEDVETGFSKAITLSTTDIKLS